MISVVITFAVETTAGAVVVLDLTRRLLVVIDDAVELVGVLDVEDAAEV